MNGEILAIGIVQIYIAGRIAFIVIGTIIVIDRFYFKLFLFLSFYFFPGEMLEDVYLSSFKV